MCPESRSLPRALESRGKVELVTWTADTWPSSEQSHTLRRDTWQIRENPTETLERPKNLTPKQWFLWWVDGFPEMWCKICMRAYVFSGGWRERKENGFSWVHSALGLQTGEGPLLCRQRPSVCASSRLRWEPAVTSCPAITRSDYNVLLEYTVHVCVPTVSFMAFGDYGTSEWGLWQGASYRTNPAPHWLSTCCHTVRLATVLSDKGRPQRTCAKEKGEGEPGASFHLIQGLQTSLGRETYLNHKVYLTFSKQERICHKSNFFFPLKSTRILRKKKKVHEFGDIFKEKQNTSFKPIWIT